MHTRGSKMYYLLIIHVVSTILLVIAGIKFEAFDVKPKTFFSLDTPISVFIFILILCFVPFAAVALSLIFIMAWAADQTSFDEITLRSILKPKEQKFKLLSLKIAGEVYNIQFKDNILPKPGVYAINQVDSELVYLGSKFIMNTDIISRDIDLSYIVKVTDFKNKKVSLRCASSASVLYKETEIRRRLTSHAERLLNKDYAIVDIGSAHYKVGPFAVKGVLINPK